LNKAQWNTIQIAIGAEAPNFASETHFSARESFIVHSSFVLAEKWGFL
jgi:hypothetical protein